MVWSPQFGGSEVACGTSGAPGSESADGVAPLVDCPHGALPQLSTLALAGPTTVETVQQQDDLSAGTFASVVAGMQQAESVAFSRVSASPFTT